MVTSQPYVKQSDTIELSERSFLKNYYFLIEWSEKGLWNQEF